MVAINKRDRLVKLNRLANFIDDLPHDRFHMPDWGSKDANKSSCGTAGCACGWAVTMFHKQGFYFDGKIPRFMKKDEDGDDLCGSQAFAWFFGIAHNDASWITVCLEECDEWLGVPDMELHQKFYFQDGEFWSTQELSEQLEYPSYTRVHNLKYKEEGGIGPTKQITPRMAAARIRLVIAKYDPTVLGEPKLIEHLKTDADQFFYFQEPTLVS